MSAFRDLEKTLNQTTFLVHYLFLIPLLLCAVLVLLKYTPQPWPGNERVLFAGLFFLCFITLPLMGWLYQHVMSLPRLEENMHERGEARAFKSFRKGIFLSALSGDLCATLGFVYYALTQNDAFIWPFLLSWGIHYILATVWLRKAREDLEFLSRNTPKNASHSSSEATG